MSNTKLNSDQKAELAALRADVADSEGRAAVFFFKDEGVTVAMQLPADYMGENEQARCAYVSVSVASGDEQKFRRKVGEFQALSALEAGQSFLVRLPYDDWADFAADTAAFLASHRDNF